MTLLLTYFLPPLIVSSLITYLTTPLIRRWAIKIGAVDVPSDRKIHRRPTPRLGGLAIYLGFVLTLISSLTMSRTVLGLLIGATSIVIIGLLDDIWGLNPWVKLCGQISVAVMTFWFGIGIHFVSHPVEHGVFFLGGLAGPITVIWLVSTMNVINLIDGLDGLAAGISVISAAIIAMVAVKSGQGPAAVIALSLLGSSLAFLKYNFAPAQIFMGDSGSMLLGYILGCASIIGVMKSTITISLAVPILLLGVPISDTAFTIFRRVRNKKGLFQPDNEHVHHLLMNSGLSQRQVVVLLYGASLILGLLAFGMSLFTGLKAWITLGTILVFIGSILFFFRRRYKKVFSLLQILF